MKSLILLVAFFVTISAVASEDNFSEENKKPMKKASNFSKQQASSGSMAGRGSESAMLNQTLTPAAGQSELKINLSYVDLSFKYTDGFVGTIKGFKNSPANSDDSESIV